MSESQTENSQALSAGSSAPSLSQMLRLWLPLAASIVMMVLEPSTINIGLGRTRDPELALAAYGIAFGLALLVEAPILMLLDASVARSIDRESWAVVRRFTVILAVVVAAIGLVVSLTPLYELLVVTLMDIPVDVAAKARPTLQILVWWPVPIAWRRAHQGLLIRHGRTTVIGVATVVRFISLASSLFAGLMLWPDKGALVAGMAMNISVTVEAVVITWASRSVFDGKESHLADATSTPGSQPLSMRSMWKFYLPLAVTTILRQTTRPLLNTGIAAAAMGRASLAAWPVVWGFAILAAGPAWSLQQLTTALVDGPQAYNQVKRFCLGLSTLFSLVLVIVVMTPLYGVVMGGVYNLSPELQDLSRPALALLVMLPLQTGLQSLLRGVLIREGCTGAVRSAMTANVGVVALSLLAGVKLFSVSGVVLAAFATLAGGFAELIWLRWRGRG